MKFNLGDKVVLIEEDRWSREEHLKIGQLYTVKDYAGDSIKTEEGRVSLWIPFKQFKKVVTTADTDAKVVRGKDWEWVDQDKNSIYGIIKGACGSGWVKVAWYSKEGIKLNSESYRIGAGGKYDLYYYDGAEQVKEVPQPEVNTTSYAKSELLVFDKYKVGDVVVSLINMGGSREEGEMFEVLKNSAAYVLQYKTNNSHTSRNSTNVSSWRAATEYEAAAFKQGITNINKISSVPPQPLEPQPTTVNLEELSMDELVKEMQKFIPGYYLGCTLEVVSIPPTKGKATIGSRFISNPNESRLKQTVDSFRNGRTTAGLDPHNTYFANYKFENLKVVYEDPIPPKVSQKPEPVTEDIAYKELEGKFVRCIKKESTGYGDYFYDHYYFVALVTKNAIRIVDRKDNFLWTTDSSTCVVRRIFDLSKGYTYDEVKDKIDQAALKRAVSSSYQIFGLLAGEVNVHLPDTSITVERPTSTKHKPDASFQVAFVDTQLRKPGKKTKIKF
jgi:hypothetical protein